MAMSSTGARPIFDWSKIPPELGQRISRLGGFSASDRKRFMLVSQQFNDLFAYAHYEEVRLVHLPQDLSSLLRLFLRVDPVRLRAVRGFSLRVLAPPNRAADESNPGCWTRAADHPFTEHQADDTLNARIVSALDAMTAARYIDLDLSGLAVEQVQDLARKLVNRPWLQCKLLRLRGPPTHVPDLLPSIINVARLPKLIGLHLESHGDMAQPVPANYNPSAPRPKLERLHVQIDASWPHHRFFPPLPTLAAVHYRHPDLKWLIIDCNLRTMQPQSLPGTNAQAWSRLEDELILKLRCMRQLRRVAFTSRHIRLCDEDGDVDPLVWYTDFVRRLAKALPRLESICVRTHWPRCYEARNDGSPSSTGPQTFLLDCSDPARTRAAWPTGLRDEDI